MSIISTLRQYRIGSFAIFDFALAFIGIYLIAPFLSRLFRKIGLDIPRISWLLFTLPIGMIAHVLVGANTPMTRNLRDLHGHYDVKILLLVLLIAGLSRIRLVKK